ncbi:MAG TPA: flavodoxin domain-containing protein [Conexivisphaerales archaeon]|nr:flavodoxin domain-containing protein [Conexivisphaerales archaeon]
MKVLVAYASKYGATKGIAERISAKLKEEGLEADVVEVDRVGDVKEYDAFVIGSALYMFHWMKEARRFVDRNRASLVSRPVWLFSSGPLGTEAKDKEGRDLKEVSGPKELDELKAKVNFKDHQVFFGAVDSSKLTGTMGFFWKMAARSEEARKSMPEGDYRDWKEIESWAAGIAGSLSGS